MASITDPKVHEFLTAGTQTGKLAYTNAVPGELVVRLRPTKVLAVSDMVA